MLTRTLLTYLLSYLLISSYFILLVIVSLNRMLTLMYMYVTMLHILYTYKNIHIDNDCTTYL